MELNSFLLDAKDFLYQIFNNYPVIYIFGGALIGHIFVGYDQEYQGTKPFFKKILPSRSEVFFERLDFIIIPFIALFFSYSIIHPETLAAAMSTGLTWNITLVSFIKKGTKRLES